MKTRRNEPASLSELLPRLALEQGAERLQGAALETGVRRVLGDWLGERLISCRREGGTLELLMAGEVAARETLALSGEALEALRRRFPGEALERLRVRAGRAAVRARPAPTPVADVLLPLPGPELARALEGIEDPELRAKLARVTARATARLP